MRMEPRRPWTPTSYRGISEREGLYRVFYGRHYIGIYDSLALAKEAVVTVSGHAVVSQRAKREPLHDFIEKSNAYLEWVADVGFQPADFVAACEHRKRAPHLVRVAPATYHLGIEGKEAPWWELLVHEHSRLSDRDKVALTQLTSDVPAEFWKAATVQHRIYCNALRGVKRLRHAWWATEVQHNVAHHMGWLAKAQARGVLVKTTRGGGASKRATRGGGGTRGKRTRTTRDGGIPLGQMGHRYRIQPLTIALANKYKCMATLTTHLSAMPTPRTFAEYNANRAALARLPSNYHDLWYFRAFFEIERRAACGSDVLHVSPNTTVDEFSHVFLDSVGWLAALAKHYDTNTVVTVLRKWGYTAREFDPAHATMHMCFAGQMRALSATRVTRLGSRELRTATRAHMCGRYFGHPARVFADACARLPGCPMDQTRTSGSTSSHVVAV